MTARNNLAEGSRYQTTVQLELKHTLHNTWCARLLFALAPLLWIGQAAILSLVVEALVIKQSLQCLFFYAALFLALGCVRALCENLALRRLYCSARKFLHDWRCRAIDNLALASPLDVNRLPAGLAANGLAEQSEAIVPWLTRYQGAILRVMIVPIVLLSVIFFYSWAAAIILICAAPVIPVFWVLIGRKAQKASEDQWMEMGAMNSFLFDRLRNLSTLRHLQAVDYSAQRLIQLSQNLHQRIMKVLRIAFLSSAVLELFAALGVALVAVYIGFYLLGSLHFGVWSAPLTLQQGFFILLLAPSFFEPMRELVAVWHDRVNGQTAITLFDGLLHKGTLIVGGDQTVQQDCQAHSTAANHGDVAITPEIKLEAVTVGYNDQSSVLHDVNLTFAAGERVAIIGHSGAGKSTLLALIAGLVPAQRGCVYIGACQMNDENAPALRRMMGWMGQNNHVFQRSIKSNILLDRTEVDYDVFQQTMADLQISHLIDRVTILGDADSGLSGGEKARMALARLSLLADRKILLLDEPTAHLDDQTAQAIITHLLKISKNRTLIIATHDARLAAAMDRTIDLDHVALSQENAL